MLFLMLVLYVLPEMPFSGRKILKVKYEMIKRGPARKGED